MKLLNFISILCVCFLVTACGNTRFSGEPNPTTEVEIQRANSGLVLSIRNALPEEQIGSKRVRPHLNAYFCKPMPSSGPMPRTEERCIQLTGVVRNGTSETFLLTGDQVAQFSEGGAASFEFSDDQQITAVPWGCYPPNDRVALDTHSKQSWSVEINQRYLTSYGCFINRQ